MNVFTGILEALRSAAAASGSTATPHHRGSNASSGGPPHTPGGGFGGHRSSTASLSDELRKHMADSYHLDYGRGGGGSIAGK